MPNDVLNAPANAPGEIAAPAFSGETAPDSASGDNEQNPENSSKPKSGFQRRIDRLTRSIGDRDRYIQYLEAAISAQAQQPGLHQPSSQHSAAQILPTAGGRPSPDHFERQSDYLEALTDWKTDHRVRQSEEQRRQQEAHQARHAQFQEKQEHFRKSTPDYDETLVDSEAPVSPAMAEEIRNHEHGPALMYFLAKNPDKAEELAALSPTALAREVGRLEAKFVPESNSDSEAPQTAAPNISRAPKPPSRVGQTARTAEKDPGEMSPTEYREWRRKQFPQL